MSENAKKILIGIIVAVIFVASVALVVVGQKHIGPKGLGMMMVGLLGLVSLLGLYNSQYK